MTHYSNVPTHPTHPTPPNPSSVEPVTEDMITRFCMTKNIKDRNYAKMELMRYKTMPCFQFKQTRLCKRKLANCWHQHFCTKCNKWIYECKC